MSEPCWRSSAPELARLEQPLVRYATRLLGDRERARDVVQDAFVRYLEREDAKLDAQRWLYTVCRNRCLDVLRRDKRAHMALRKLHTTAQPPAATRDAHRQLLALVDELSANQRAVVVARFRDGCSYAEISASTGLSKSNVGYLLHTAIAELRARLAEGE